MNKANEFIDSIWEFIEDFGDIKEVRRENGIVYLYFYDGSSVDFTEPLQFKAKKNEAI